MMYREDEAAHYWEKQANEAMNELEGLSQAMGDAADELNKLEYELFKRENTIHLLRKLVEDYLTQIGMNIHFRQMFYQIVGEPYPDWFEVPEPDLYERQWMEDNSMTVQKEESK